MADLTSPADVAALLDQQVPAGSAAAVAAACAAASAVVRGYVRGPVGEERAVVVLPWAPLLVLPGWPVRQVHAVTAAGAVLPDGGWSLAAGGLLAVPGRPGQLVEVDATCGWPAGSWQLAAARHVATRVAARTWTNPMQRSSYTGPEGLAFAGPDVGARLLTPDERAALDPLRAPVVAQEGAAVAGALEINVGPVVAQLDGMAHRAADLTGAWPAVGRIWADRETRIFAESGPGWAPLSSKSLMAPRVGGPLVRTGGLRDALTSASPRASGPRFAVFGPPAGFDARGGVMAKRGAHQPVRDPVPPLRPAEKKKLLDAMAAAVLGRTP